MSKRRVRFSHVVLTLLLAAGLLTSLACGGGSTPPATGPFSLQLDVYEQQANVDYTTGRANHLVWRGTFAASCTDDDSYTATCTLVDAAGTSTSLPPLNVPHAGWHWIAVSRGAADWLSVPPSTTEPTYPVTPEVVCNGQGDCVASFKMSRGDVNSTGQRAFVDLKERVTLGSGQNTWLVRDRLAVPKGLDADVELQAPILPSSNQCGNCIPVWEGYSGGTQVFNLRTSPVTSAPGSYSLVGFEMM